MSVKSKKRPFYISDSFEVVAVWAANFAAQLSSVATKYSISTGLQTEVTTANAIIQGINQYNSLLGNWLKQWQVLRAEMFNPRPDGTVPLAYPAQPLFPPLGPTGAAYILTPFICAAEIILASPLLTQADIDLLGLVPAPGRPVAPGHKPREKAEDFNYPWMKANVANGTVTLRIIRGNRWLAQSALLQVDRDGSGQFVTLAQTNAKSFSEPAVLPSGGAAGAWCYRAIYVDGLSQISDWSPALLVGIMPSPPPFGQEAPAPADKILQQFLKKTMPLASFEPRAATAATNGNGAAHLEAYG